MKHETKLELLCILAGFGTAILIGLFFAGICILVVNILKML